MPPGNKGKCHEASSHALLPGPGCELCWRYQVCLGHFRDTQGPPQPTPMDPAGARHGASVNAQAPCSGSYPANLGGKGLTGLAGASVQGDKGGGLPGTDEASLSFQTSVLLLELQTTSVCTRCQASPVGARPGGLYEAA